MADIYQSAWFAGVGGHQCRVVIEEKGPIYYEFLEYDDGKRDPFQWSDDQKLICGRGLTRMGSRCIDADPVLVQEIRMFLRSLPKGSKIVRNGTKVVQL